MRATTLEVPKRRNGKTAIHVSRFHVSERAECSNFVDLARRMNITADEAIRQFIALGQRGPA